MTKIYVPSYGNYLPARTIAYIEEASGKAIEQLTKSEIEEYLYFIYGVDL